MEWNDHIRADDEYHDERFPNFWLMDDHRWGFYAWEKSAGETDSRKRYSLIHLDYHYDGCNDFEEENEIEKLRKTSELSELEELVRIDDAIRKDSFIAPAVIRGLLKEIHFYCPQHDTELGIDENLLERFDCKQFLYDTPDDLKNRAVSNPIIFDLCLDLFNKSDQWEEGDLWTDEEITQFLDNMASFVTKAEIVTVSFSFGYSGSEEDTRHLAKLVLNKLVEYRGVAKNEM